MTASTPVGSSTVEEKQAPEPALLTPSTFTLGDALAKAGLPLGETMVIRHAYVKVHKDGFPGINADSTFDEIMTFTSTQSRGPMGFKKDPARYWVLFLPELGSRARLWAVVENMGEILNDGPLRMFELHARPAMLPDLAGRLLIQWASPRAWWVNGTTAQSYPILEVVEPEPEPFPGFDSLVVDFDRLQAVVGDPRYAASIRIRDAIVRRGGPGGRRLLPGRIPRRSTLRDEQRIDDTVLRRVRRRLDQEEVRFLRASPLE